LKKIIVLGSSGMLGQSVYKKLTPSLTEYDTLSVSRGKDNPNFAIKDLSDVFKIVEETKPSYVINCVGLIKPRIDENNQESIKNAICTNSLFPFQLAELSARFDFKVIQIATDCVFDGAKGPYNESALHNPHDIYGKTKSLGEVKNFNFLNIRCSIIGRDLYSNLSLLEWFLRQPKGSKIVGFENHLWNGVPTNLFSEIIVSMIENDLFISGTYHLVPGSSTSKFELLKIFQKIYDRGDLIVEPGNALDSIDRRLSTEFPDKNNLFWSSVGYSQLPMLEDVLQKYLD
jgi:dTDP-4-dehydrorhamnose reductase